MLELIEKMLGAPPMVLALVVAILALLATGPLGKKVSDWIEKKRTSTAVAKANGKMTGTGLVLMLEADKSPLPRHWVDEVDRRFDHKTRSIVATLNSHMETTREKLEALQSATSDQDEKLDDQTQRLARIEGKLEIWRPNKRNIET